MEIIAPWTRFVLVHHLVSRALQLTSTLILVSLLPSPKKVLAVPIVQHWAYLLPVLHKKTLANHLMLLRILEVQPLRCTSNLS